MAGEHGIKETKPQSASGGIKCIGKLTIPCIDEQVYQRPRKR